MKRLLLTLDYELYGDGSGDVFKHVVEPTNEIMALAEHYGVRITIMFEYLEYLRIKQEWDTGNKMGYNRNPVQAMENQLRDAYSVVTMCNCMCIHNGKKLVGVMRCGKWNVVIGTLDVMQ